MLSDNITDVVQADTSTIDATLIILIGAVAVSLFIGVWNIVQTKRIESRKYKYELFKEMVDWLVSVIECGGEIGLRFMQTKLITPEEEKRIAEEAIAKYLLVSSRVDFILGLAESAGFPLEVFERINEGIVDVMSEINEQLESKEANIPLLNESKIQPLNNECAELTGKIASMISVEFKLKRGDLKLIN